RPWIQFTLNGRRIINHAQPRAACQRSKIARMLRCRWMMQKFSGKSFHHSIDILHSQLMFVDKQPIRWRLTFKNCKGALNSPNPPDERAGQQRDDAEMCNEKGNVMFAPGPAREGRDGYVRGQEHKQEIEPGRAINVS